MLSQLSSSSYSLFYHHHQLEDAETTRMNEYHVNIKQENSKKVKVVEIITSEFI